MGCDDGQAREGSSQFIDVGWVGVAKNGTESAREPCAHAGRAHVDHDRDT